MSNSNQTPPDLDSRFCLNYFEQVVKFYKEELRQQSPIKTPVLKKCKSLIESRPHVSLSIREGEENNKVVSTLLKDNSDLIFLLKNPTDEMICKLEYSELERILFFIPVEKLSWMIVSDYLYKASLTKIVNFYDLHVGVINYLKLHEMPKKYEPVIVKHLTQIKFDSKAFRIDKKFGEHPVYGHLKFSDDFWKELIKNKYYQNGCVDLLKINFTPVLKKSLMEACPQLAMKKFAEHLSVDDYINILETAKSHSKQFQRELVKNIPFVTNASFDEALDQLYKRKTILETL